MKRVYFSRHVARRMIERGTTEHEIQQTIRDGRQVPAREGKIAQRVCMKVGRGRNNKGNADFAGHLPADFLPSAA